VIAIIVINNNNDIVSEIYYNKYQKQELTTLPALSPLPTPRKKGRTLEQSEQRATPLGRC